METVITMWALSVLNGILGSQPRDKEAMLNDKTIEIFLRNLHEIGLSSRWREMLLFVSSNVAPMTSRGNQQYDHLLTKTPSKEVQQSMNNLPSFLTHLLLNMHKYKKPQHFPKCCFTYTANARRNTSPGLFTFHYLRVPVKDINRFAYIE